MAKRAVLTPGMRLNEAERHLADEAWQLGTNALGYEVMSFYFLVSLNRDRGMPSFAVFCDVDGDELRVHWPPGGAMVYGVDHK